MSRIYLETNAIRSLNDFEYDGDVFTSDFVLFELLSGINSQSEFDMRKGNINKIMKYEIAVHPVMADEILARLSGYQDYIKDAPGLIPDIAKDAVHFNSYDRFSKQKVTVTYDTPLIYSEHFPVLEWLQKRDKRIESVRERSSSMLHEDAKFMRDRFTTPDKKINMKGLAQFYWSLFDSSKYDEERLGHAAAFISQKEITKVREDIDDLHNKYNFRLFITAQAMVFAKAKYWGGEQQDRNNPSDLLHLLYLDKGDILVSNDKIYCDIAEGISDFSVARIDNEKSLSEVMRKYTSKEGGTNTD